MSVIKSKRGESGMEFLHTARELQMYTIQKCVSFPKRYTFYVGQPIAALAVSIHNNVKMGNGMYPLNPQEVQRRRNYFLAARGELDCLVSQIEIAQGLFGIEQNVMEHWMGLVEKELRLVDGILKKDRERYKNIGAGTPQDGPA